MSETTRILKSGLPLRLVVLCAVLISHEGSGHESTCDKSDSSHACSAERSAVDQPIVFDHLHDFQDFVRMIAAAETPQQIRALYREHFVERDPGLYDVFVGDVDSVPDSSMRRIADAWIAHQKDILEYRAMAIRQILEVTAKAEEAFGARLAHVPQYITLNLMKSNAQVRLYEGQVMIFYGMDTNAQMEDVVFPTVPRDLRATIAHELFHAHHWRKNAFMKRWARRFLPPEADAPLWINLWSEGLANCAVRHVYPDANIDHIMAFEGLWSDGQGRMEELATKIKADLESTDSKAAAKWLFLELPERSDGLPNKAGYIVGTAVAHHILKESGLEGATTLEGAVLRESFFDAVDLLSAGRLEIEGKTVCQTGPDFVGP